MTLGAFPSTLDRDVIEREQAMEFSILGPVRVWEQGRLLPIPRGKRASVLVALLAHRNRVVPAERLSEWLWDEATPEHADATLRTHISRLRAALATAPGGDRVLLTEGSGYELRVPSEAVDADRFQSLVSAARAVLPSEPMSTASTLREALALWQGRALQGFEEERFARAESTRLEEMRLAAIEDLMEAEIVLGHHAAVIGELQTFVADHPLREGLTAQLMRALYCAGRQAEALQSYRVLRDRLLDELGIDPSPALRHLERAVLRQEVEAPSGWITLEHGESGSAEHRELQLILGGRAPLPARLEGRPEVGFVGREAELAALIEAFTAISAGNGRRVVLIQGEPGMGKTTLAAEFARLVHGRGALVLYGRCEEELTIPYQAFAEALDHYMVHVPEEVLVAHVAEHGGQLAGLVPALARRLPELPPQRSADADTQRYLLFTAVVGLLASASADQPVVVVLDDLHWADKATLLLLRYLVGAEAAMRLLVLGTYRGSELAAAPALGEALAALRRHQRVERLELTGLEDSEVVALLESGAGHELGEDFVALAQQLRRETGGNPFFLLEIVRHLVERGSLYREEGRWLVRPQLDELGMPPSLREVVGQRVARLGEAAGKLLTDAAVVGREFDVKLLCEVATAAEDEVVDTLERARAAALLTDLAPGRYGFAHAVIQHSLYDTLGPTRRHLTHRRVAQALERLHGAGAGPRVAELARHWVAATPPADARKALQYAHWAAEAALAGLAFEEAVRWFSQALELQEDQPTPDQHLRAELLIGLGSAQRLAGDPAHRETLLKAARLAQDVGDTDRLVRAALVNNRGTWSSVGVVDAERVAVLEAALTATIGDRPERARLFATLAVELTFGGDWAHRRGLAAQALSMARRLADPDSLARVLNLIYDAVCVPETLEERLVNTAEQLALADAQADPILKHAAHRYHLYTCADAGDLDGVNTDLEVIAEAAAAAGDPFWLAATPLLRSWRSLLAGHLEGAEAWAAEFPRLATNSGAWEAGLFHAHQLLDIRRHQDRVSEMEEFFVKAATETRSLPYLRAVLAGLYCDSGRQDEAEKLFAADAANDFAEFPYDLFWLYAMVNYAEVCARLGRVEPAARLYERLAPWHGQIAYFWWATGGAVAFYLGMLATVLGRYDQAETHFAEAAEIHERLHAPYWIARTRLEWARMLFGRRGAGDGERARALLQQVAATATEFGFAILTRHAASLKET